MEILWELLATLGTVFKSIFLAMMYTVIPAPRKSVKDEVVLVTGSGSGIGRLMAIELAEKGAVIVAWDISKDGVEETARMIKAKGGKAHTYVCDVSNREAVKSAMLQVCNEVGEIDILINNAGIVTGKKFLDCSEEELLKTVNVNLLAHFWTVRSVLPKMMQRNHGHIVTIASFAGIVGTAGLADYSATKFGNVGFTECLDYEISVANKTGVHTTTVCPHFIGTGLFEGCVSRFEAMTPPMEPEYAAGRIVRAILTNQKVLFMPRMMYLFALMKMILPVNAGLALHKFFGATHYMDSFVGRAKKD